MGPEAQSLAFVFGEGCLPYGLKRKDEVQAAIDTGLRRVSLGYSFPAPSATNRLYAGRYLGHPKMSFEARQCSVLIDGGTFLESQRAVEATARRVLGVDYERRIVLPAPTLNIEGYVSFCARDIVVSYYPRPRGSFRRDARGADAIGYEVSVGRVPCSALGPPYSPIF